MLNPLLLGAEKEPCPLAFARAPSQTRDSELGPEHTPSCFPSLGLLHVRVRHCLPCEQTLAQGAQWVQPAGPGLLKVPRATLRVDLSGPRHSRTSSGPPGHGLEKPAVKQGAKEGTALCA